MPGPGRGSPSCCLIAHGRMNSPADQCLLRLVMEGVAGPRQRALAQPAWPAGDSSGPMARRKRLQGATPTEGSLQSRDRPSAFGRLASSPGYLLSEPANGFLSDGGLPMKAAVQSMTRSVATPQRCSARAQ